VTDPEPLPADHPLWTLPNVLITPHVGGWVPSLDRRSYALVGDQLRRHAAGELIAPEHSDPQRLERRGAGLAGGGYSGFMRWLSG